MKSASRSSIEVGDNRQLQNILGYAVAMHLEYMCTGT